MMMIFEKNEALENLIHSFIQQRKSEFDTVNIKVIDQHHHRDNEKRKDKIFLVKKKIVSLKDFQVLNDDDKDPFQMRRNFFPFLFLQTLLFCHAFIVVVIIIIISFPFFSKISRIKYFAKIKYEIVGDDDFSISLSLAFLLTSIYFRSDRVIQAMKTDHFE